jgi:hypothetical protein
MAWLISLSLAPALWSNPGVHAAEQLPTIVSIAAGGRVFIRADGSVWSFIDTWELIRPIQVPGLKDTVRVGVDGHLGFDRMSTGYALRKDGTVWSWTIACQAEDDGLSNTCEHSQAVRVPGIDSVADLSVGRGFVIVLKRDGSVWGWGNDTIGELGNTPDQLNLTLGAIDQLRKYRVKIERDPVQIPISADIIGVSVTLDRTTAIDRTGQVWMWGWFSHDPRDKGEGEFVGESGLGAVKLKQSIPADKILAWEYRTYLIAEDGAVWGKGISLVDGLLFGDVEFTRISGVENPRMIAASWGAILWIDQDGRGWQSGPGFFPYDRDHPERREAIPTDAKIRDISADDFAVSVLTEDGRILSWLRRLDPGSKPIVVMGR